MNLNCDIVQDLLPLYEDGICSPASREAVERHLASCSACRTLAEGVRALEPEEPAPAPGEDRAVAKSFRKVRRRWLVSLMAALLVIPVVLLSVGQYRGQGACFSNLDDAFAVWRFVHALETGDLETAAALADFETLYTQIQTDLTDDFLIDRTVVTIGDREYAVSDQLLPYISDGADELDQWAGLIYHASVLIMVPEEIWDTVMTIEPELCFTDSDGTIVYREWPYIRLETSWGTYVVEDREDTPADAGDFVLQYDIIPVEIYNEALPELRATAEENHAEYVEYFSNVSGMTPEEFESYMLERYVNQLQVWVRAGGTMESTGWKDAYHVSARDDAYGDGYWTICWGILGSTAAGGGDAIMHLSVRNGKVTLGAWSTSQNTNWDDPYMDLLIPWVNK